MKKYLLFGLLCLALVFTGCTEITEEDSKLTGEEKNLSANVCTEKQKQNQICTREYNPVCGNDEKTYPTACVGCSTGQINSWEEGECEVEEIIPKEGCENLNGTWLAEFNECEYIPQENCEALGGTFSNCESACRNNPEAAMCTMQCIQVCDFE